jgi:hypothetical protein
VQTTCPSCRSEWQEVEDSLLFVDAALDKDAVDVYLKWLYSSGKTSLRHLLQVPHANFMRESFDALLRAHTVGIVMEDVGFKSDVVESFFESWKVLGLDSDNAQAHVVRRNIVENAYGVSTVLPGSRKLLVDLFVATIKKNWFRDYSLFYPRTFTLEVADACLQELNTKRRTDEIFSAYIEEGER